MNESKLSLNKIFGNALNVLYFLSVLVMMFLFIIKLLSHQSPLLNQIMFYTSIVFSICNFYFAIKGLINKEYGTAIFHILLFIIMLSTFL